MRKVAKEVPHTAWLDLRGYGQVGMRGHWILGMSNTASATISEKVERSHRMDDKEFYQMLDQDGISDDIVLVNEKVREWEDYYNYHRPHGAIQNQTPFERLMEKT